MIYNVTLKNKPEEMIIKVKAKKNMGAQRHNLANALTCVANSIVSQGSNEESSTLKRILQNQNRLQEQQNQFQMMMMMSMCNNSNFERFMQFQNSNMYQFSTPTSSSSSSSYPNNGNYSSASSSSSSSYPYNGNFSNSSSSFFQTLVKANNCHDSDDESEYY